MAIHSTADFSRLKRDNETPVAARSGFDALNTRRGDFARMLQDQAAERASSDNAALRSGDGASARRALDQGDSDPAGPPKPNSAAPTAGGRVDVEQRNAATRQAQQGLQQAGRERADLENRRAADAKAESARASPTNPAVRKPVAAEANAAAAGGDPVADEQHAAQEAPATMAAWLRNAARAHRADSASARGAHATALASDDVPPRSDDAVTVAPALLAGTTALDPAAALAAGGALVAGFAGLAAQATGTSAGEGVGAGSTRVAGRSDSGAESATTSGAKGRQAATDAAPDDQVLPAGADAVKAAVQDGPAHIAAGGDATAQPAAGELGATQVERRARLGGEGESDLRTADLGQLTAVAAWDTRVALDGVRSSDAMTATVPIDTPVQDEGFGEHVGLTVGTLARQGIESATLQLNPAEMGPVAVSIALAGDQARVNFTADREDTRKALEASMNQLDAAFRADGMVLVEAQVAPTAPAQDDGGADTGRPSGQGHPQGGPADGGRSGAEQGAGDPRNRWAAAAMTPAARTWDLRVDGSDGSIVSSSPRTTGAGQLDLYA